jgi:predicted nucleic acid-binding protein
VVHVSTAAVEVAYELIRKLSVKTLDALHIAVAHEAGCDEFVTAEKRGRSMLFKTNLVTVVELPVAG